MFQVDDIKRFQYVCVARAGLTVCSEREMSKEQIEREIFEEFKMACSTAHLPPELEGISRELLLRSKNFVVKVCKPDDYHDGESVWRKFGEIKRVVVNDITNLYMKNLPGGQLPSGKSKSEMIEQTRKEYFHYLDGKTKNPDPSKKCPTSWRPKEWSVFLIFGAASNEPDSIFYAA